MGKHYKLNYKIMGWIVWRNQSKLKIVVAFIGGEMRKRVRGEMKSFPRQRSRLSNEARILMSRHHY